MAWTIKSINSDGSLNVYFDYDKSIQNLSDKSIKDLAELKKELDDYESAYLLGKVRENTSASLEVEQIVNISSDKITVPEA